MTYHIYAVILLTLCVWEVGVGGVAQCGPYEIMFSIFFTFSQTIKMMLIVSVMISATAKVTMTTTSAISLTTGLCTSQNALSWLSRIFLSILSLFLSTLRERKGVQNCFERACSLFQDIMIHLLHHKCLSSVKLCAGNYRYVVVNH